MEYDKKDWKRSDGQLRAIGREGQDWEKKLTAYQPSEQENTREQRPNELFKLESSYGGISFGANRQGKLKMAVYEKRRSNEAGLKRDNQEVQGSRTAGFMELRGDFYANSHKRADSALVYEAKKETPALKMAEQMQELLDEVKQSSAERELSFFNRRAGEAEEKEIQGQLRRSLENGDREAAALWSRRRETFLQEKAQKEQMYRKFYKELVFAKEKAERFKKADCAVYHELFAEMVSEAEDGTEEEADSGTNQKEKTKRGRKPNQKKEGKAHEIKEE